MAIYPLGNDRLTSDLGISHVSFLRTSRAVAEIKVALADIRRLEKEISEVRATLERNMQNIAQELGIPTEEAGNDTV